MLFKRCIYWITSAFNIATKFEKNSIIKQYFALKIYLNIIFFHLFIITFTLESTETLKPTISDIVNFFVFKINVERKNMMNFGKLCKFYHKKIVQK